MAVCTNHRDPVEVKLVRLENAGSLGLSKITVEFAKADSVTIWWSLVEVQYRLAGRWLDAEGFPQLNESRLFVHRSRETVVFTVPEKADACRFQLRYSAMRRGYILLQQHGLWSPFEAFCRRVLRFRPREFWSREINREVRLPKESAEL